MRLLLCLAERAGQVVSIDDLLNQVWPEVTVSPDSAYQAVASLRRQLGDDAKEPSYIATVPRLGYRMVAEVRPWTERADTDRSSKVEGTLSPEGSAPASDGLSPTTGSADGWDALRNPEPQRRVNFKWSIAAAFAVMLVFGVLTSFRHNGTGAIGDGSRAINSPPLESIAVLPFLDLTEGMQEETFADGMTEELIDRLSKIPGLRVTPPTSSFLFKGKQIPVADIAKNLDVAYLLDGSVRKSGDRLRVAARLIRAENGYVVWSETYDRPFDDILMVQDDIAGEATKALKSSIQAGEDRKLP